jgi:hypothetical protein
MIHEANSWGFKLHKGLFWKCGFDSELQYNALHCIFWEVFDGIWFKLPEILDLDLHVQCVGINIFIFI